MLLKLGREVDLSVWEDRYLHLWWTALGRRTGIVTEGRGQAQKADLPYLNITLGILYPIVPLHFLFFKFIF